jgi:hypothetical protein
MNTTPLTLVGFLIPTFFYTKVYDCHMSTFQKKSVKSENDSRQSDYHQPELKFTFTLSSVIGRVKVENFLLCLSAKSVTQ